MVYVIADTHVSIKDNQLSLDRAKASVARLLSLTSEDILIHLGDVKEGESMINWDEIAPQLKCKVIYIRGNHDTNGKYDFVEEYHLGERMSDTSITFKHHFNTDKLEPTPIGLKIQGHLHPNPLPAYSAYFNVFICAPGDLYSLDEIKIMIRKCMYQSIYLSNKAWVKAE